MDNGIPTIDLTNRLVTLIKELAPFTLVQGDEIQRTNPHTNLRLNSNCAWLVSGGNHRSAYKLKLLCDELNSILDVEIET